MSDFIHCNKCYIIPGIGKRFCLTSCSHIFCSDCSVSAQKDRCCPRCTSRCSVVALDSSTKSEVRMYFEPIEQLIAKVAKIEKFQRSHRENLISYLRSETSKSNLIQEKWEKKVVELTKEINHLRAKHKRLETAPISKRSNTFIESSNCDLSELRAFKRPARSNFGQFMSSFGNSRAEVATPSDKVGIDNRSRGSSRISLRTVSDISPFRAI